MAATTCQGRVWFAISRGVHWIDPRELQRSNASPGAAPVVLALHVDDGCGIEAELLASGNLDGHWGLTGMRERARLLGATLSVTSQLAQGTVVRLRLPRWRTARGVGV
jgi:hypothetical protein